MSNIEDFIPFADKTAAGKAKDPELKEEAIAEGRLALVRAHRKYGEKLNQKLIRTVINNAKRNKYSHSKTKGQSEVVIVSLEHPISGAADSDEKYIKDTLKSIDTGPEELAMVAEVLDRIESGFCKFEEPMQTIMRFRLPIDMGDPEDWTVISQQVKLTVAKCQVLFKRGCEMIDKAKEKVSE